MIPPTPIARRARIAEVLGRREVRSQGELLTLLAAEGIEVRANRPVADYVSFTGLGHARLLNGGLQMGTFTLCRRGAPARRVVLANSGRVRVEKSRDACPD